MGRTPSNTCSLTPLECFIKNFQDFKKRAGDYGAPVDAFRLRKFCELEWPTFSVGWPSTGTYDINLCLWVRKVVYGRPGHPDQMPYIDVWIDILTDQPSWLKKCQCEEKKLGKRQTAVLVATTKGQGSRPRHPRESLPRLKAVLPGPPEDDELPPRRPLPYAPPSSDAPAQVSPPVFPDLSVQGVPFSPPTLGGVLRLGPATQPQSCL